MLLRLLLFCAALFYVGGGIAETATVIVERVAGVVVGVVLPWSFLLLLGVPFYGLLCVFCDVVSGVVV